MALTTQTVPDGYLLVFEDTFEGHALDRSKWFPFMLPHWTDNASSAARYQVEAGLLKLQIDQDQTPWLPTLPGCDRASNLQTGQFSGAKGSTDGQFRFDPAARITQNLPRFAGYTPQYGYFEIRLRALPVTGYHTALWMIGCDEPHAGEIRIFELHGHNITPDRSRVDYGILKWDDPVLTQDLYEDWVNIDASQFHVYGCEWTPEFVEISVDGAPLRRIAQSPAYRMQFMLGLYETPGRLRAEDAHIPWPRQCEVDYFRGYRNPHHAPPASRA
jgi:Glycosyl hydrolases family 16